MWLGQPSELACRYGTTSGSDRSFSGIRHEERVFLAHALAYRHEVDGGEIKYGPLDLCIRPTLGAGDGSQFPACSFAVGFLAGRVADDKIKCGAQLSDLENRSVAQRINGADYFKRLAAVASELDLKPRLEIKPVKDISVA